MFTNQLPIAARVTSTFQLQSVVAAVQNRATNLVYSTSAYQDCSGGGCDPQPGWANTLSLEGLAEGSNWFTVTAVDVFGNSNQVGRSFIYDTPPGITVQSPPDGFVVRSTIHLAATVTDANSAGVQIAVYWKGAEAILALATNSLNTVVTNTQGNGQAMTLVFRAIDAYGQVRTAERQVYVQTSSNLVETAHVSEGWIKDVQPDRLLFARIHSIFPKVGNFGEGLDHELLVKSRSSGIEQSVFYHTNFAIYSANLGPNGPILLGSAAPFEGYSFGYGIFQKFDTAEILWARPPNPLFLTVKGHLAAWGSHQTVRLNLLDLRSTNSVVITNGTGYPSLTYDLADNGDVVFSLMDGGNAYNGIFRYRAGAIQLLASNPTPDYNTNRYSSVKTDGTNAYYLRLQGATHKLIRVADGGETVVSESPVIDPDYLVAGGWVAYAQQNGGVMQVWRRSPSGQNTQLTFYGTPSTLAAVAPNGEVAFYNNSKLYISKGTWPPAEIASVHSNSGLKVYWRDGRWQAILGRSLFQIYDGAPQAVLAYHGSSFNIDLIGAQGQRLVTECSTNFMDWTPVATNDVTDGGDLTVETPVDLTSPGKFYRLRTP